MDFAEIRKPGNAPYGRSPSIGECAIPLIFRISLVMSLLNAVLCGSFCLKREYPIVMSKSIAGVSVFE